MFLFLHLTTAENSGLSVNKIIYNHERRGAFTLFSRLQDLDLFIDLFASNKNNRTKLVFRQFLQFPETFYEKWVTAPGSFQS